ncbi:MAG TPA: hypothetical protein DIT39_03760 [Tissierellales bacterium]|nr:hypothetical protein [Tissierellales bacterium]
MNCEELWRKIILHLKQGNFEFKTLDRGLWFNASSNAGVIFIDKAIANVPSCAITITRKITEKDFLFVCSYYPRWAAGEVGLRHEVSRGSRNTAYIFALIEETID